MSAHAAVRDELDALWKRARSSVGALRSLAPGRQEPTPLAVLAECLIPQSTDAELATAFGRALATVVEAQIENFPQNLFWDFDYAASRLMDEGRLEGGIERLHRASARIVALEEVFGTRSKVQFRYVHDFMYGFDWARWVRADAARASVGPFDEGFITAMGLRGLKILELIGENDTKYPALPPGVARNPFGFSREPAHEERLHRDLAERGLVPVEAWRLDACPAWDRPFQQLREERARALGLWKELTGG